MDNSYKNICLNICKKFIKNVYKNFITIIL